jgi:ribosome-associated protein
MPDKTLAQQLVEVLDDAKARDVRVIDVRGATSITDDMIIASGTSSRHVSAVADRLIDTMRQRGVRALGVEGRDVGEWVLIDFGDALVHVMLPETREHYQLEKLWSHAAGAEASASESG